MNETGELELGRHRLVTPALMAVVIGFAWQYLQYPLYDHDGGRGALWSHVVLSALGDGALVLLLYLVGWYRTRDDGWYEHPSLTDYTRVAGAGVVAAAAIEVVGVYIVHRWGYAPRMPLLPVVRIGAIPVLEGATVPVLAFVITAWLRHQLERHSRG